MLGRDGQSPLDQRETRSIAVSVFDVCDRNMFEEYSASSWLESNWDDLCNAQEYNENNLPDSETASRLNPAAGQLDFVSVPDRWNIESDKVLAAADGEDGVILTIQPQNAYMDIRTGLVATVQSSLLGSKLESQAVNPDCAVQGTYDPLNPTSLRVLTEACSGGKAELVLTSTTPGRTRVTVTGNGFGCLN